MYIIAKLHVFVCRKRPGAARETNPSTSPVALASMYSLQHPVFSLSQGHKMRGLKMATALVSCSNRIALFQRP
jgi:hypothetical protein